MFKRVHAVGFLTLAVQAADLEAKLRGVRSNAAVRGVSVHKQAPSPDSIIPQSYWDSVNSEIAQLAKVTQAPINLNAAPTTQPSPWQSILDAMATVSVVDSAEKADSMNAWQSNTPSPGIGGALSAAGKQTQKEVSVVPYDMRIGAEIMYAISESPTSTPPPTQDFVDQTFNSQCPMVLFSSELKISAPHCSDTLGSWTSPVNNQTVMRWSENSEGGLGFAVDSVITGKGSVPFAAIREQITWNQYRFSLDNCMNLNRFMLQESIVKVDHMSPNVDSTGTAHNTAQSKEAYFYQYIIYAPDGNPAAQTNLYRMDDSQVNITLVGNGDIDGKVFAVAKRKGSWKRDQWRECSLVERAWKLKFPLDGNSTFSTPATIQDLRLVAAAVVTLMAYRDESLNDNGLQQDEDKQVIWHWVAKSALAVIGVLFALAVMAVLYAMGLVGILKKLCFKIETALLPKRAVVIRAPPLNPTW